MDNRLSGSVRATLLMMALVLLLLGVSSIYEPINQWLTVQQRWSDQNQDAQPSFTDFVVHLQGMWLLIVIGLLQFKLAYEFFQLRASFGGNATDIPADDSATIARLLKAGASVALWCAITFLAIGLNAAGIVDRWMGELRGLTAAGVGWMTNIFVSQIATAIIGFCLAYGLFKLRKMLLDAADRSTTANSAT